MAQICIRSVWRYLFEAPLKCGAAALVRRDSNIIQNYWQEHIEAKRYTSAFAAVVPRRWVQRRYDREVNRQQADDQSCHASNNDPRYAHEALAGDGGCLLPNILAAIWECDCRDAEENPAEEPD